MIRLRHIWRLNAAKLPPLAPQNVLPPVVAGYPQLGSTLSVDSGSWIDSLVPPAQKFFLGVEFGASTDGLNGGNGFQSGQYEERIYEEGTFQLTFANAPGSDGASHLDRFLVTATPKRLSDATSSLDLYRPGDEWFEIWDENDLLFVGTPITPTANRGSIIIQGSDATYLLKKTREFWGAYWNHAPRDVWEHYTSVWAAVMADDFQSQTFTGGSPTSSPIVVPQPDPPPPSGTIIFEDEFEGTAGSPPDATKWINIDGITYSSEVTPAKAANAYLDGNSNLVLRVVRESWMGKQYSGALIGTYRYQTGWPPSPILASWPVPFRYEVRFKLPNVAGAWLGPGWNQNIDHTTAEGLWELDCGETRSTFPTTFGANQHHWVNNVDVLAENGSGTGADGRTNYHIMAVEATASDTKYYLDGTLVATHTGVDGTFGVLLHNVIADLSSWGSGGQNPSPSDPGPWYFYIDYVRVTAI